MTADVFLKQVTEALSGIATEVIVTDDPGLVGVVCTFNGARYDYCRITASEEDRVRARNRVMDAVRSFVQQNV